MTTNSRPSEEASWGESADSSDIDEPSSKRSGGWQFEDVLPHDQLNWIQRMIGRWIEYLDSKVTGEYGELEISTDSSSDFLLELTSGLTGTATNLDFEADRGVFETLKSKTGDFIDVVASDGTPGSLVANSVLTQGEADNGDVTTEIIRAYNDLLKIYQTGTGSSFADLKARVIETVGKSSGGRLKTKVIEPLTNRLVEVLDANDNFADLKARALLASSKVVSEALVKAEGKAETDYLEVLNSGEEIVVRTEADTGTDTRRRIHALNTPAAGVVGTPVSEADSSGFYNGFNLADMAESSYSSEDPFFEDADGGGNPIYRILFDKKTSDRLFAGQPCTLVTLSNNGADPWQESNTQVRNKDYNNGDGQAEFSVHILDENGDPRTIQSSEEINFIVYSFRNGIAA